MLSQRRVWARSHRRQNFLFFLSRAKDELPLFPALPFLLLLFSSLASSPFPLLSPPPSPSVLSSPLPLEVGPLNTVRGSGERCKLAPSGVWGPEAAADKRFGAYWSQTVQLWWQQFLLIFLRTNVIFCTKQA